MKYEIRDSKNFLPFFFLIVIAAMIFTIEPALAQEQAQRLTKMPPTPKSQLFTPIFREKFVINIVSVFVLVMLVYLPIHRKKDYFFTFLILNFLVFMITFLMSKTSAFGSMGVGLGLLAFFSLLRLRTDTISMKDMTYLFVVLTLGLINGSINMPQVELLSLNAFIVALTFGLDKDWLSKSIHVREMKLSSLEFIVPEKMDSLIAELRSKTGLDIRRVKVLSVDLTKDTAVVEIFHY